MERFTASPLALFVCLIFILLLLHVDAQNRVDEVQVLTRFRKAIDIPSNVGASYWFTWDETDENACSWVGVTCTSNFTVVALDLSGWPLTSLTSVEILSNLPDLRELDMSASGTSQTLLTFPEDIGSLTHLTRLDLSNNMPNPSSIPQSISACRSLRYLSLENCFLTGAIPDLSALVNLQILLLARNYIEGPFPKELFGISSLVIIDLSDNLLNGSIPSLVNSPNLVNLNYFVGFEEPFSINAPNLQCLRVAGNELEGSIPLAITKLHSVLVIDLSGNLLSGNIPADITKLLNVSTIDMSSNQLSGNIPPGFSNIMSNGGLLLQLSNNQLSGSIPLDLLQSEPFHDFDSSFINVSSNHLNGTIPAPAARRITSPNTGLDFSHNQLEGPVPWQLSGFFVLDLHDNLLSGDIVDVLAESQAFQPVSVLELGNNHFTGDLTRLTSDWANWSYLSYIGLSNNDLSWRPTELIPDPVGAALENFQSSLVIFSVSGNNFAGTSLPKLGVRSENLLFLDLSDNQLKGVISSEVFNIAWLPNLLELNLSNNQITGAVPQSIMDFYINDTLIDLSNNKLSGQLPIIPWNSSLIDIPQFLAGNAGLCGSPLLRQCSQTAFQGVQWWIVLLIVGGSMTMAVGSCLFATWRWKLYRKRHEQDADLIRTLMERELVTLMSLRYLWKATNGFAETAQIGEGGFGTVYKGHLNDGTTVAIKKSKHAGSKNDKGQFLNEVRILSQVNHRHLVKLLGCCMENKVALLVFEFVSNGTLQEHLQGKVTSGRLSWKQRLTIAVQTADALNYLHSGATSPIYHRDVKSANILLNDDLSAKVADFGISKLVPAEASHISTALQGTVGYLDPDYFTSFQLTDKSDVYSFGVVLLELISGKPAVDIQRQGEESSLVFFATPHVKSGHIQPLVDPALMETYSEQDGRGRESILSVGRLAMTCVDMRSEARPTMNDVSNELLNLWLELTVRTSMNEGLGCMNEEENENTARQVVALSQILSSDRSWSSRVQHGARAEKP